MGRAHNTRLSSRLAQPTARDHRFDAVFGARRTPTGPDETRDAIGTVRTRNFARLLDLLAREDKDHDQISENKRYITGLCARGYNGVFIALDGSYRSEQEMMSAI